MEDTGCERAESVFSVAWHFLVLHFQVRRVIFGAWILSYIAWSYWAVNHFGFQHSYNPFNSLCIDP
jgi:hypothetical protein